MSQLSLASQRGEIFSEFQPLRGDIFSWATGKMWFIQLHVLWEKKKIGDQELPCQAMVKESAML